jgi:hypothetical protein
MKSRPRVEQFSREYPACKAARDALIAIDCLDRGEHTPWLFGGHPSMVI